MHKKASGHLFTIAWFGSALVVLGFLLGSVAWALVVGLSVYTVWTLRQAIRLHLWLYSQKKEDELPESYGLWGDLFDGLYQLQTENQAARDHLKSLVKRVQSSTNALNDVVVTTNSEGAMDWWNIAAGDLFGFRPDIDRGQLITNLLRDPAFKHYFEAKDYSEPLELDAPARPDIKLRIYITLFGDDDRLVIAQNITRIHNLERMRRDFIGNVSHEMRTPLTVIKGYLETISQQTDSVPPKWKRACYTMLQQADRMDILLEDLLLLSKYETMDHATTQRAFNIAALVSMVSHDAAILSGDHNHQIVVHCEYEGWYQGDEGQLRSAFSNLIFNAVKYTPDEGRIDVQLVEEADQLLFIVRDTGVGFDPVHIPRLTERFYRADPSRDKATGGSGLGLAIVKHVLLNHDGHLAVDSSPGVGSEFICHLPGHRKIAPQLESA